MLDWWLPENVSTFGRDIDWLFHLIYYITGITFILVFATMLAFIVMYRDRPGRKARYTHGNTTLEIAAKLRRAPRTVERKLHAIRTLWEKEPAP